MKEYIDIDQYQALEKQVSFLTEQNKKLLDILEKLIYTTKSNDNQYVPIKEYQKKMRILLGLL